MARTLCIEAYRSPWFLLALIAGGLVGTTITHVILQRGLELSKLLPSYGIVLGFIIVWIIIRKACK